MQSLKSRFFIFLIKNRHLFKFKLRREVVDENFSIDEFRERVETASERANRIPDDIEIKSINIREIHAEWIIPQGAPKNKVLMYIHGGGFISGNCDTHRMHVIKFAKSSGISCLLFDYRLAPENKFPAAVEDCVIVYDWLLKNGYEPSNIVIGGESAGGTLTFSMLLALKDSEKTLPKAAFSISPLTDSNCKAKSFNYNAKKDIATLNSWNVWTKLYIGDSDVNNPLISPIYGELEGLPPLFICVGTHEVHYDDAVNFAEKAEKAGVSVKLSVWNNMVHAFPIMSPLFPEAKNALDEICTFVKISLKDN